MRYGTLIIFWSGSCERCTAWQLCSQLVWKMNEQTQRGRLGLTNAPTLTASLKSYGTTMLALCIYSVRQKSIRCPQSFFAIFLAVEVILKWNFIRFFTTTTNNNNNRICIAQVCRMTSEALDGQLQSCYTQLELGLNVWRKRNVFRLRLNRATESYSTKYQCSESSRRQEQSIGKRGRRSEFW